MSAALRAFGIALGLGAGAFAVASSARKRKAGAMGSDTSSVGARVLPLSNLASQAYPAQTSVPGAALAIPARVPDPFLLVVHVRGFGTSAEAAARDLLPAVPIGAVLLLPELVPYTKSEATNGPGALGTPGGLSRLVTEVLSRAEVRKVLQGARERSRIALSAHSGGYRAAAAMLDDPRHPPFSLVALFDALYGAVPSFERFARGGGRFQSIFTLGGSTERNDRALAGALGAEISSADDPRAFDARLALRTTGEPHPSVARAYLRRVLSPVLG